MKRPQKTFVVEHKRRTRNGTEASSIWSGTTGRELQDLLQAGIKAQAASDPQGYGASEPPIAVDTACLAPKGRILEAKLEPIASSKLETSAATEPPRRPGRPRKVVVHAATLLTDDAPAMDVELPEEAVTDVGDMAVQEPLAPKSPRTKPSFSQRRREARKKLPPGERWKRHLKF